MPASDSFPPAQRHGELRQLFDGIFFVSGAARIGPPIPMTLSRNMTVVREGEGLTLINSMRLDDEGLRALDALGEVRHVIRIAGFHGMDDPFYRDRYGAKVWAMEGSAYTRGFNADPDAAKGYFQPDVWMTADTELPLANARLFVFESSTPREGLVVLDRDGGIVVSGDSMQHMARADEYCNLTARLLMPLFGMFKPYNIGPGWLKVAKPSVEEIRSVLDLPFEHVLPVHGVEVIGGARDKFRPAVDRLG